jgi:dTDP-4-dehydrorhamnose 3,5-epimerase
MPIDHRPTELPDVILYAPRVFKDSRGFFLETFHAAKYAESGLARPFVQDNYSHSARHVLRGMHYQLGHAQAKLVSVIWGTIFDVAVDVRRGSPTFGRWVGQTLSDENRHQLYIPEGFAHGFCVLSDRADVMYKCTDYYSPSDERGIRWDDPEIGIRWPVEQPVLADRDRSLPLLRDMPPADLPAYRP